MGQLRGNSPFQAEPSRKAQRGGSRLEKLVSSHQSNRARASNRASRDREVGGATYVQVRRIEVISSGEGGGGEPDSFGVFLISSEEI